MSRRVETKPATSKNVVSGNLQRLLDVIKSIKYGSVTLVIQDGHWIQLDVNEKMRLHKTVT